MVQPIVPAVMSGGAGSRLWPVSRRAMPKQLLALTGERTMLQETVARALDGDDLRFAAPMIIANAAHRAPVEAQLAEMGVVPSAIALEPEGRNTAAAAATAAALAREISGEDTLVLMMPADHFVRDPAAFRAAVAHGAPAAARGRIVTLGIAPQGPETGYGYIRGGAPLPEGGFDVAEFKEKPDRATAAAWLAEGGWYWNAGLFLFRAGDAIAEMQAHCPDVLGPVLESLDKARRDGAAVLLDPESFRKARDLPFDIAVMEKTARAAVVPVECGWNDVGAFDALWGISEKDRRGAAVSGSAPVTLIGCDDIYVRADGIRVAAAGVKDVIIVATPDAVLVVHRDQAQKVKDIVEALKKEGGAGVL